MQTPTGTQDLLAPDSDLWQWIESTAREVFHGYGYDEIRTPMFEDTSLFRRGVGEATDIVEKQMYTIPTGEGESVTLRPEGTASVVRAYLSNNLHKSRPLQKLYYIGPMFRYERPQRGRYRQLHQIGMEILGSGSFAADVEALDLMYRLYQRLGVAEVAFQINALGCGRCRPAYRAALRTAAGSVLQALCRHCRVRYDRNILRILDCKAEPCRRLAADFPKTCDYLCAPCRTYHEQVRSSLQALGLPFRDAPMLVRGLDYYTRTVWEVIGTGKRLGSQDAVGAGGRYDGLVQALGGPAIPGVGFALGVERLCLAMRDKPDLLRRLDLYVVLIEDRACRTALALCSRLRRQGLSVEMDLEGRSVKAQMRTANRKHARFVAVIGPDELKTASVNLRDMDKGLEQHVKLEGLAEALGCMLEPAGNMAGRR